MPGDTPGKRTLPRWLKNAAIWGVMALAGSGGGVVLWPYLSSLLPAYQDTDTQNTYELRLVTE